jgi:UDP-GlcNAc:undecaprenyl-phosphate/decaprenyl-phosphate GlcNAc-1-phosphate transferase
VAVPTFMLLGSLWVTQVPHDVALVAALLAGILAAEIGRAKAVGSPLVRLVVYIAAVACVYLVVNYPGAVHGPVQLVTVGTLGAMVAGISGYLRFAPVKTFGTTPTDYLILFAVLALLLFGNLDVRARAFVEIVVYAVVVLYACEVMIGLISRRWNALHLSALAALTIMAIRGVL